MAATTAAATTATAASTNGRLPYLSTEGRHVAMWDLSGRTAPEIERYKKIRFRCHHCLQVVEDYCIGYPTSWQVNPKTGKVEIALRGMFGVGCVDAWSRDTMHSFWKENGGMLANMLMTFYGATQSQMLRLMSNGVFSRTDLPWFVEPLAASPPRSLESGPAFHARTGIVLQAPDPNKVVFFSTPMVGVMEETNLGSSTPPLPVLMKFFKNAIFPQVSATASTKPKPTYQESTNASNAVMTIPNQAPLSLSQHLPRLL